MPNRIRESRDIHRKSSDESKAVSSIQSSRIPKTRESRHIHCVPFRLYPTSRLPPSSKTSTATRPLVAAAFNVSRLLWKINGVSRQHTFLLTSLPRRKPVGAKLHAKRHDLVLPTFLDVVTPVLTRVRLQLGPECLSQFLHGPAVLRPPPTPDAIVHGPPRFHRRRTGQMGPSVVGLLIENIGGWHRRIIQTSAQPAQDPSVEVQGPRPMVERL